MRLVGKDCIDSLVPEDSANIDYCVMPENCHWKLGVVKEIIEVRWGNTFVEGFSDKELGAILKNVCSS